VETEIDEVARHRDVRRPPWRVGDDQRDVPATQERERVLAEPRCIARLDGIPPAPRRDHLEESLGARSIELHSRRELHENDRELLAKPGHRPYDRSTLSRSMFKRLM